MTAADLRAYMQPVDGPLAFVREQIVLADGRSVGEAMAGDPWVERDLLWPVFAVGEAGLPVYRLAYLELPREHWKSGGAAAISGH
jgi:hypothetical protein